MMGDEPSLRESPRARAWATRRAKYGEHGHAGAYRHPADPIGRRALATVISLHLQETLSEGQCCAALNIDRVAFRTLCDDYLAALEGSRKDGSSKKSPKPQRTPMTETEGHKPSPTDAGALREAVAWRYRHLHPTIDGAISGWTYHGERPELSNRHRWEIQPLYAQPLPARGKGESLERAALMAVVHAGGADPAIGKARFSVWSLDKLAAAYDQALAALNTGGGHE